MNNPQEKLCVICASKIDFRARKCIHCNSYQKNWKNILTYVSNTVGLFSLSGALILFSIENLPQLRKMLFWKDEIRVTQFRQPVLHIGKSIQDSEVTLLNKGDGNSFVSHILLKRKGSNVTNLTPIQKIIKPENITRIVIEKEFEPLILQTSYRYIASIKDREWQFVNESATGDNFCFIKVRFAEQDPRYQQIDAFFEGELKHNKFDSTIFRNSLKLKNRSVTKCQLLSLFV